MIKPLSQQTAEQLCAQQVITSLPDCIKQLIDNSIDAKATFIKVTLYQYGKTKIEVVDNGSGIDNFDFLGKKGTTSKHKPNDRIDYLGFRGEAIHSIGRVSGDMQIESKSVRDGFRRKFNVVSLKYEQFRQERLCHGQFNFQLPNREGSRNTGTKVQIQNIFQRLPVRHIQLQSKHKQCLKKTNELIKQFCLIYPEIQFIYINIREGKEDILIQTSCHQRFDRLSWLQRIKELDQRVANNLTYISHALFEGFVLNKIQSGSSKQNGYLKKHYHYLFVNRRPIDPLPAILSTLNDLYKKYNNNTKYAFVINLKLDHQQIDVNLTPNKREIFIRKHTLDDITDNLRKEILDKVVEDIPTLSNFQEKIDKQITQPQLFQKQSFQQPSAPIELQPQIDPHNHRKTIFFPAKQKEADNKDIASENLNNFNRVPTNPFKTNIQRSKSKTQQAKKSTKSSTSGIQLPQLPKITIDRNKLKQQLNSKMAVNFSGIRRISSQVAVPIMTQISQHSQIDQQQLEQIRKKHQQAKLRIEQSDAQRRTQFMEEMKQVKIEQNQTQLKITLSTVSSKAKKYQPQQNLMEQQVQRKQRQHQDYYNPINDGSNQKSLEDCQENQVQHKSNSNHDKDLQMRIKSKINVDMTHIFSKFNQLKLNKKTQTINSREQLRQQPLLQPSPLTHNQPNLQQYPRQSSIIENNNQTSNQIDPTLSEQLGQLAPKHVSKQNFKDFHILGQFNLGFIITLFNQRFYMVDQHAADQKFRYQQNLAKSREPESINCFEQKEITPIECDQIQEAKYLLKEAGFYYTIVDRKLLKLERCPVFNEKKLGLQFFNQIVTQKKQLQKIPIFSSICASMACRAAIKVGQPLSKEQMKKEVSNLSTLASPWNCPHGRPTLIELGAIESFKTAIKIKKQYKL